MPDMDPNLTLLAIAVLNAFTAILAWRTRVGMKVVEADVATIEKATNSMKDALVKATGDAAHAAGKEEGRIEGDVKAADLAKGRLQSTEK